MGDPHVEKWRQRGKIFMWNNRNPPEDEWNISADDAARDALVDLLTRMENGRWSSKKQLSVRKPVVAASLGRRYRSAKSLTLRYPKGRIPDDHWDFAEKERELTLTVGLDYLRELREDIADMKQGGGDYCIDDENPLWILWFIDKPAGSS